MLDNAIAALPQTEFLQTELRRAWQRAVIASRKQLTDTQTVFALENYFDHALQLPNDYLAFLDPEKLAERFVGELEGNEEERGVRAERKGEAKASARTAA